MKRDSNAQSLGDVLKELVKAYRLEPKLNEVKLQSLWEETFGPVIAKHTTELKLQGTTLVVYLDSSVLREELSYGKQKLVDALNEAFGKEVIRDVVLK